MASQISIKPSFYASAPTSPSKFSHQNVSGSSNNDNSMSFYSMPASPTGGTWDDTCRGDHGPVSTATSTTSPNAYEDADFEFDDFEFETSRRFNVNVMDDSGSESSQEEQQHEDPKKYCKARHGSLPAMAFADELFSDGKVMPLNPPPCLQYANSSDNKFGKYNSTPTSPAPGIPGGALFKIPYPRRSLWNDDFDPFMVALENVKEEKKSAHHRRAWSMLPLRACTQWQPDDLVGWEHQNCLHSNPLILSQNKQIGQEQDGLKSPIRLAEPKGVLFARRARMVKMGYQGPIKPPTITVSSPMVESEENAGLGARSCSAENKWQRIISFALRGIGGSTMRKTSDEHKQKRDQNVEFSRPKILRKLSFRSSKKVVQCNEEKQVPQMTKMTIVRYRPKLLLCMGYGAKYAM
ncbi:uncharacterized protein LOC8273003 [Ricinus communis]|uniref:uncharacterized protein LOC8273003 n=1 Tax=Ricinus communis TaxID=3988 RepID=UPI00201B0B86|nr:uncharacterized protein LOC8273003 [Ricinus communis]